MVLNYHLKKAKVQFSEMLKKDSAQLFAIEAQLANGVIEKNNQYNKKAYNQEAYFKKNATYKQGEYKTQTNTIIDINKANQSQWEQLNGIGAVLSLRIIKFRDALGGFVDINQIAEVYGVESETFVKIKPYLSCMKLAPKVISFNTSTYEQLNNHPYISTKLANQIVNYRDKVGFFKTKEETKQLYEMDDRSYQRLSPYIGLK